MRSRLKHHEFLTKWMKPEHVPSGLPKSRKQISKISKVSAEKLTNTYRYMYLFVWEQPIFALLCAFFFFFERAYLRLSSITLSWTFTSKIDLIWFDLIFIELAERQEPCTRERERERERERKREKEREGERERERGRERESDLQLCYRRTVLLSCLKKVNIGGVRC